MIRQNKLQNIAVSGKIRVTTTSYQLREKVCLSRQTCTDLHFIHQTTLNYRLHGFLCIPFSFFSLFFLYRNPFRIYFYRSSRSWVPTSASMSVQFSIVMQGIRLTSPKQGTRHSPRHAQYHWVPCHHFHLQPPLLPPPPPHHRHHHRRRPLLQIQRHAMTASPLFKRGRMPQVISRRPRQLQLEDPFLTLLYHHMEQTDTPSSTSIGIHRTGNFWTHRTCPVLVQS